MPIFSVIVITGGMSWKTGMQYCRDNFAILETEVTNARGSVASIATRLAASLNQDGTLMAGSTVAVDFKASGFTTMTKVDTDTFTVTNPATDLTAILSPGRPICFNSGGTAIYAIIKASSFAAATTTVDIFTTNVPATISTLDYAIVHPGSSGSFVPIEPIASIPAYSATYACRVLLDLTTGVVWLGNPISGGFTALGGSMLYKDFANSHAKGGTGITVTQVGGAVSTRLDFNTGAKLAGKIKSLVVCGTDRGAITCNSFKVEVAVDSTFNADEIIATWDGLNGTVLPSYGLVGTNLDIAAICENVATNDSLWVRITNRLAADSSVFDIEAVFEQLGSVI